MAYDFNKIEKKWQKKWSDGKIFSAKEGGRKPKYYVLDMFPYPSGAGLHIGHAFVFTLGDVFARFKRLQGFNVLYPIGYDALGLPAENAAIKAGTHPENYTKKSMANFMKQQKAMGWSYDWDRVVNTSDPSYYGWDQWIFLKMLEKGVAYRKKAPVNWCPKCQTVLANEQVSGGCCWRHEDTEIEIKHLEQWFFKITDYAEELLNHDKLDWPERAKVLQKNWIGKSHGVEINFEIDDKKWPIFTTRPDTIHGVTFMVVSAQHLDLMDLVTDKQKKEVEKFLKKIKSTSEKDMGALEKEGVFTGSYAINPINGEKVPVYAGNFVFADYGSGMVMAVPAHDQRDFEFAKKYGIEIRRVISGGVKDKAHVGDGKLINSGAFNDLEVEEAKEHIALALKGKKLGKKVVQYKLRDWLVSRQRYWGTPIPVVYCDKCGVVPLSEKDLPLVLPKQVKFGKGNPLKTNEKWINTKCPKCGGKARRETDTMDTFVNSSWYYLRYADAKNKKRIFDSKKANYWAPVDQYIGGPEQITMHLIYIRFYTKFLRDLGLLKFDEPALRYFTQGIVKGSDGEKMSKSKGNVVEPLEIIKKYGADALRLYLVSNSSPDSDFDWNDQGIDASSRFIRKVYEYFEKFKGGKVSPLIESKMNRATKSIEGHIQNFKHNLAVINLRELFASFSDKNIDKKTAQDFLKLLHVYCPHVTEELWGKVGGKGLISVADWPKVDEKKINDKLEQREAAIGKVGEDIRNILGILEQRGEKDKSIAKIYAIPNEVKLYEESLEKIQKATGLKIEIKNIKDAKNEGKKIKAVPGKPGILIE